MAKIMSFMICLTKESRRNSLQLTFSAGKCIILAKPNEKVGNNMGKLEMNKKIKEEAILDAGYELFTTQGFSKTTVSDITEKAGVAKGTFYLYFTDKFELRKRIISHKSSTVFRRAANELNDSMADCTFEEKIIRLSDNIINQLANDKPLLKFIAYIESWKDYKEAVCTNLDDSDINFALVYRSMLEASPDRFRQPEMMLFIVAELVVSTCSSTILQESPCTIDELKPFLYDAIRLIIQNHKIRQA